MPDGTRLEDRYVEAVLASIADAQRADVEAEIRASIADATEARIDLGQTAEAATIDVLEGLGDPAVLGAELTGRPLWLIGPRHYLPWLRLIKRLLAIVLPIVGVTVGALTVIDGDSLVGGFVAALSAVAGSAVHIVFWVTVVFAFLERSGESGHLSEWKVGDLPDVHDTPISLSETVWSVTFLVAMIALLAVVAPDLTATVDDTAVAVFAPGLWNVWMPVVIGLLAVEAVLEVVKYRRRRWTFRLAVANLVVNAAFATVVAWLLLSGRLLDPEFVAALETQIDPDGRTSVQGGIWVTAAVVIGASAWSAVDGFVRERRRR